jgi:hypothetical protein
MKLYMVLVLYKEPRTCAVERKAIAISGNKNINDNDLLETEIFFAYASDQQDAMQRILSIFDDNRYYLIPFRVRNTIVVNYLPAEFTSSTTGCFKMAGSYLMELNDNAPILVQQFIIALDRGRARSRSE